MKPKRRVICPDCMRPKILFETERKAQNFIKWNASGMEYGGDTLRAYYCPACCGWHVSHHEHQEHYDQRTDDLIGAFKRTNKALSGIDKLIHWDEYSAQARSVYAKIPEEVKATGLKTRIKRFLDKYLKENGIADNNGELRTIVYSLFKEDMEKRKNR